MHKIFELKEMDQEQLLALAADLKVKNYKKLNREDLVYAIIDYEAAQKAARDMEKSRRRKLHVRLQDSRRRQEAAGDVRARPLKPLKQQ